MEREMDISRCSECGLEHDYPEKMDKEVEVLRGRVLYLEKCKDEYRSILMKSRQEIDRLKEEMKKSFTLEEIEETARKTVDGGSYCPDCGSADEYTFFENLKKLRGNK